MASEPAIPSRPDAGLDAPAAKRDFPAPSTGDKLRRLGWNLVWALVYRLIPTPLFGVRRAILKAFGAKLAPTARPYPGARIWAPWNLRMEDYGCLADGVNCYNVANVTIGAYATVSQGAHLCTPSHDFRRDGFPLTAAEIVIGPRAWVATEAFIGPGVSLGAYAVVGARAVLNRSVPEHCVVAGNPAVITGRSPIAKRFGEA